MTQQTSVQSAVHQALAASLPQLDNVDPDADLTGDMGLDSVQVMDLVMEIEDRLDISIPVDILAEVRTLNQLIARIRPLVADRPA